MSSLNRELVICLLLFQISICHFVVQTFLSLIFTLFYSIPGRFRWGQEWKWGEVDLLMYDLFVVFVGYLLSFEFPVNPSNKSVWKLITLVVYSRSPLVLQCKRSISNRNQFPVSSLRSFIGFSNPTHVFLSSGLQLLSYVDKPLLCWLRGKTRL